MAVYTNNANELEYISIQFCHEECLKYSGKMFHNKGKQKQLGNSLQLMMHLLSQQIPGTTSSAYFAVM